MLGLDGLGAGNKDVWISELILFSGDKRALGNGGGQGAHSEEPSRGAGNRAG